MNSDSTKEKTLSEEVIQVEVPIGATPQQIFAALTHADELTQWFAEQADISETEGRYDFWGRLTPEAPSNEEGHHRLLSWETGRSLS